MERQELNLYFSSKERLYFSLPLKCDFCKQTLYIQAYIFDKYARSKRIENKLIVCCNGCLGKNQKDNSLYDYWDGKKVIIILSIKPSWNKIFMTPPIFKNSKGSLSIFNVADKQYGNEVIINNTVHSFKNQNAKDSISFEEAQEKLKERDQELLNSSEDPTSFLKEQQFSGIKVIKEGKKKKLLGVGKK